MAEGRVRLATRADLGEVASWIANAGACEQWAGWRVRFPIDLAVLPSAIEFTGDNAWSLIVSGEVAAFGQLLRKSGTRAHLARIIVNPAMRRCGHGEAIVRALIARALGAGLSPVSLNVFESNRPALALYRKLGFAEAVRPDDEPPAVGACYMECAMDDDGAV